MKKFLSLLCMITCIFGLTACGTVEEISAYDQGKMDKAIQVATESVIPSYQSFRNPEAIVVFSEYTDEEIEYLVQDQLGFNVDGYAYATGIESFNSAYDTIGELVRIGEATAQINDDQIIVHVTVHGEKKNAEAEIIFSNDMFMHMESAALNPSASMGELMEKAALNTLIGMGTVFVVLILISLIISAFSLIPKIQAMFSKKKEKVETTGTTGIDNAVAQITTQEESVVEMSDDLELVAVIAAAIAASEGATSTDGFVVRSIRKVRR